MSGKEAELNVRRKLKASTGAIALHGSPRLYEVFSQSRSVQRTLYCRWDAADGTAKKKPVKARIDMRHFYHTNIVAQLMTCAQDNK